MTEVKTLVSQNGELMGRFVEYECYEKLEKENAELKAQLSESRKDFWRAVKNVGRLRAQIEKMQCCGNCSKRNQCEMNVIDSLHCDKWS